MTLSRRTPLKRSPIKRKAPKPYKPKAASGVPDHVADAVIRRTAGRCALTGEPGEQLHHRKLRSKGGEHTEANLVYLSRHAHHDIVHANVSWSVRHGWIVPSWYDPEDFAPVTGCGLDCGIDHFD